MTTANALYSVAEIREIERAALASLPPGTLMERAGAAVAEAALQLMPNGAADDAAVLVLAGPGNNGGDALEAAALLAHAGLQVTVVLCAGARTAAPDAQQALARARNSPARFEPTSQMPGVPARPWSLVLDGLFGIGLERPITGPLQSLIAAINALPCPLLALDVPSGLNADTGALVGVDGVAVRATHTITFIGDKPGLHTGNGRDYAGAVQLASLDIEERHFMAAHAHLVKVESFAQALRRRPQNSHKGSFGDVAIIGGARGMSGAPILAARAAAHCGAGRVFAGFVEDAPPYDSVQPELMCRVARDLNFLHATLVVGPGLGTSRDAHDLLTRALAAPVALVLDADALNMIALEPSLQHKLCRHNHGSVLTPHPLEAARLLGIASATVQADRLHAAREIARRFNTIVVLKGSGTVIARPDGQVAVNTTGNPGLATAGTGDVLAGLCGALLAQRWPAWEAASGAVWLHGAAADALVEQGVGPVGLCASELIARVRAILNDLIRRRAGSG